MTEQETEQFRKLLDEELALDHLTQAAQWLEARGKLEAFLWENRIDLCKTAEWWAFSQAARNVIVGHAKLRS